MSGAPFEFATAGHILFGAGRLAEIGGLAAGFGRRAFLVTGAHADRAAPVRAALREAGVAFESYAVGGEPTIDAARQACEAARSASTQVVIGFGGGSALDLAKAVAALLANGGDPLDYLEVIGEGKPLARPSLPCIAIPTTAGTGSEVTRNAVLASKERRVKVSLRSRLMLPSVALIDPALTLSLPPKVTAHSGLDALTQVIEPYLTQHRNAFTDLFCREGMRLASRALRRAWQQGDDLEARTAMAQVSLYGGMALANAGLGAVHGFAGPLGGMFPAPHGALCAALLPHAMAVNLEAILQREPQGDLLERFTEIARLLTGDAQAQPHEGVTWLKALNAELGIPPLRAYGVRQADFPQILERAGASSSMRGNPIALSDAERTAILERAL